MDFQANLVTTTVSMTPSETNAKCVVLVPAFHAIEPDCELRLRQLERRGYKVWRMFGHAAIDHARNVLATEALFREFEELMWIDADIVFDPDSVDQLRSHRLPIVTGIYARKNNRALACHTLPETEAIHFGVGGGLVEILYAPGGFLHTRREVYDKIRQELSLPTCNERFGSPVVPYFQPMVLPDESGHWYLAEDFAFSQRARQAGYRIMADSSIRLWHYGSYPYGWEDAGVDAERFSAFEFKLWK